MPTMDERKDAVESRLEELARAQRVTDTEVGELPQHLMTGVRAVARGVNARISALDSRVTGVERKIDRLDDRMGQMEGRMDRFDSRLEAIGDDMAAVLSLLGGKHGPRQR